jgi:hypothetical protein
LAMSWSASFVQVNGFTTSAAPPGQSASVRPARSCAGRGPSPAALS